MQKRIKDGLTDNSRQLLLLALYTILVVFFCSKMSPFYPIQEWSDINLYFNIGKAMMNGQTLYVDLFDHKGPVIFVIYGVAYLISNDSFLGMFAIQSVAWVVLSFSIYFTAKLFLDKSLSCVAAILFLPLFLSHTLQGGSAEEFVTVFIAVSLFFFIKYFTNPEKHSLKYMYVHGLMWGLVFFTKFNLVVFWVFPLLAVALILILQKEYKNLIQNILYFVLGAMTIALPIFIYFIAKGALNDAYEMYFSLNVGRVEPLTSSLWNVIVRFYQRLRFETIEFFIILMGAFSFPICFIKNNIAKASLMLSFLSLFAIIFMPTGYVYYYSIPYYIYGGLGIIFMVSLLDRVISLNDSGKTYILIAAAFIGLGISVYRKDFFDKFTENEDEKVVNAFTPILKKDKEATLLNLGLDNANAVFTYASIMPNVKYFLSPNLTYEAFPEMRDEQTTYIEQKKTKYIILATRSSNYEYFNSLPALKANYSIIAESKEFSEWINDYRTYYLYKRKDE